MNISFLAYYFKFTLFEVYAIVMSLIIENWFISCFFQKGNPLLKHIRNVTWTFADVVPDYLLGQSSCALYLRFEFHSLSVYSLMVSEETKLSSLDLECPVCI